MNPQYGTALSQAATANQNLSGGGLDTYGIMPDVQNLRNLAQIRFKAGASNEALGPFGGEASNVADIEEAKRKAAEAAADAAMRLRHMKEKKTEEEKAALNDPDNYTRAVSADGGYDFYDPLGNKITVQQYSRATGKQIDKALEGSGSQQDIEFTSDYKKLKEYGMALTGDEDAMKKFKESNKEWLSSNSDKTYAEIVSKFRNYYSGYFQPNQNIGNSKALATNANTTLGTAPPTQGNILFGGLSDWLKLNQRPGVQYKG